VRAAEAGVGVVLAPLPFAHLCGLVPVKVSRALAESLATLPPDDLWLVGHRALRDVPRIAVTWAFLERAFAELDAAARAAPDPARGRARSGTRYARAAR
jgi:hypothetical protein